jgi:hypothetical protein
MSVRLRSNRKERFGIAFSQGCAWRAIYLTRGDPEFPIYGSTVACVGIDPDHGVKPELFITLPTRLYRAHNGTRCIGTHDFRVPLPHVPWSWCIKSRYNRLVMSLYQASRRFYHSIDGRY